MADRLAALYQETGRAGRDGGVADCVLFYHYADTRQLMSQINDSTGSAEQKENLRDGLRMIVQYCMNRTDCRRRQVLQYFGEDFPAEECHKTCDNCQSPKELEVRDITDLARAAVHIAKGVQGDSKGVTMLHALDIFRGQKPARVRNSGALSSLS